jgi:hypothetical protein
MAIVLTIAGLIIGGVLIGQTLIQAAGIRGTVVQINEIDRAMIAFKDKYEGLPGDITNATLYWPGKTTNGNGNGIIESTNCGGTTLAKAEADCGFFNGERPQVFVQLGLAGLATEYDGSLTLGKGYPAVKMRPDTGMYISGPMADSGASNMNLHNYATGPIYIAIMVCNPSSFGYNSNFNDCAIFKAEEAHSIDDKLDDGQPLSGKMLGHSHQNQHCVNGSKYNINSSDYQCNLMYDLR